jgi:hypothetical protein
MTDVSDQDEAGVLPNPIVTLMAHVMNYLNVSLYEGRFSYNDEQSRATLNEIYDSVSKTPLIAPSVSDSEAFYRNVGYLRRVTDTDDADYGKYMCAFRRYIVAAKRAEQSPE